MAFNGFTWSFGKEDAISVVLGVGLDVYASSWLDNLIDEIVN